MASLEFDDSWMDETGGPDCNEIGEHRDDQDVMAKLYEEELELEARQKVAAEAEAAPEPKPCSEHVPEKQAPEMSDSVSANPPPLMFDDSWMEQSGGPECNVFGEYSDDRDVAMKHLGEEDEEEASRQIGSLPSDTNSPQKTFGSRSVTSKGAFSTPSKSLRAAAVLSRLERPEKAEQLAPPISPPKSKKLSGSPQGIGNQTSEFEGSVEFWKTWNRRQRKGCTEVGECTCFEGVGSLF